MYTDKSRYYVQAKGCFVGFEPAKHQNKYSGIKQTKILHLNYRVCVCKCAFVCLYAGTESSKLNRDSLFTVFNKNSVHRFPIVFMVSSESSLETKGPITNL